MCIGEETQWSNHRVELKIATMQRLKHNPNLTQMPTTEENEM